MRKIRDKGIAKLYAAAVRSRKTKHSSTSTYYAIDDGDGNELTSGLQPHIARKIAQRLANERGESVYLYEVGGYDPETEEGPDSEEIVPEG
jgi:hypothetical protein